MKTVFIGCLESWDDDYKRPDASTSNFHVFTDRALAYRTMMQLETIQNIGWLSDEREEETAKYYGKNLHAEVEFSPKFIEAWENDREDALGEAEFGINSSGVRFTVTKATLTEETPAPTEYQKGVLDAIEFIVKNEGAQYSDTHCIRHKQVPYKKKTKAQEKAYDAKKKKDKEEGIEGLYEGDWIYCIEELDEKEKAEIKKQREEKERKAAAKAIKKKQQEECSKKYKRDDSDDEEEEDDE